jgi:uncharacterized protein
MTVESRVDKTNVSRSEIGAQVIDCDVHELVLSPKELAPYMQEPWREWSLRWLGPSPIRYVHPLGASTGTNVALRKESETPRLSGADLSLMQEEILDRYGMAHAVLTSSFFPGAMKVQAEFATAAASAYNDWVIENWLERDPRLLGSICVAPQQPEQAAREIDRVGGHPQMVQVMLPIIDSGYGHPSYHPIFAAAVRNDVAVAMHQTGDTAGPNGLPPYYAQWHAEIPLAGMAQVYSLVFNGVFAKFQELRVIVLETGFTWLPHLLLHADQKYKYLGIETPWLHELPSNTLKGRLRVGTQPIEEMTAADFNRFIELMGSEDMLVFCTDYPHWDSDEPLRALPSGLRPELRKKIFYENARAFYRLP